MKTIIRFISKYILMALYIIVVLLYMSGMAITQMAIVLFCGVVVIDLVYSIAGGIGVAVERGRRKAKAKQNAQKAKDAGEAVAAAVKDTGIAIKGAAESTWDTIREKGESVGTAIRDKLTGGHETE